MGKSGSELLIYGLIVAGFLLFSYLSQQLARKAREQQEAAERETAAREAAAPELEPELEEIWRRPVLAPSPAPKQAAPPPAPPIVAPAPPKARAPHALFRRPEDLRRAIVVMTVLGPCRALDPGDRR